MLGTFPLFEGRGAGQASSCIYMRGSFKICLWISHSYELKKQPFYLMKPSQPDCWRRRSPDGSANLFSLQVNSATVSRFYSEMFGLHFFLCLSLMVGIRRIDNVSEAQEVNFTSQKKNLRGKFMILIGKGRHAPVDVRVHPHRVPCFSVMLLHFLKLQAYGDSVLSLWIIVFFVGNFSLFYSNSNGGGERDWLHVSHIVWLLQKQLPRLLLPLPLIIALIIFFFTGVDQKILFAREFRNATVYLISVRHFVLALMDLTTEDTWHW